MNKSQIVSDFLATYVLPGLGALFATLMASAIHWLQSKTKNEKLRDMEYRFGDSITTVVKSLSATVVPAIKAAAADGKISPADREVILQKAVESLQSYWGPKGMTEVKKVLGFSSDEEMKASVVHDIEEAVFNMKKEKV